MYLTRSRTAILDKGYEVHGIILRSSTINTGRQVTFKGLAELMVDADLEVLELNSRQEVDLRNAV
ncbi:MAG: hypothetical protein NT070_11270 [Cyanobacteria bacterium]|nr:hypothetical protein [Cyanobacteriota bacterium]